MFWERLLLAALLRIKLLHDAIEEGSSGYKR